jgi:hypothetical protein
MPMPEWIQQWLHQNAPWLDPLNSLVGILVVVIGVFVFKPLRWAIPKLWSSLNHLVTKGPKRPQIILGFVAMDFPHSHWGIGTIGDKPITSIVTKWHVTQALGSGVSVRLLKAHLRKPFAKYLIQSRAAITGTEYAQSLAGVIPEGETRTLIINCNLSKVLKPEMRLNVQLAVEDQFAQKHKLPPIMVRHFQARS